MGIESVPLYKPDLRQLERDDAPFSRVHEVSAAASIREFDDERPVTAQQIGEFLFRVARMKDHQASLVHTMAGVDAIEMDFGSRPYPSGGGLYEIEFYLVIQKCQGLDSGLYHYAPDRHVLERLKSQMELQTRLLSDAGANRHRSLSTMCRVLVILAGRAFLDWLGNTNRLPTR